jgi:hypothetical protein
MTRRMAMAKRLPPKVTSDITIKKWKKSKTEEIRIVLSHFKGRNYVSLRIWYYDPEASCHNLSAPTSATKSAISRLMQCSKSALRAYGALTRQILRFWGDAGRVCGFADPDRAFRIAFLRRRDHQILRPRRYFAKLANCFCRYADVSIRLDMHCGGQSANRYLQRGDAFGLVFHVGFLTRRNGIWICYFCFPRSRPWWWRWWPWRSRRRRFRLRRLSRLKY